MGVVGGGGGVGHVPSCFTCIGQLKNTVRMMVPIGGLHRDWKKRDYVSLADVEVCGFLSLSLLRSFYVFSFPQASHPTNPILPPSPKERERKRKKDIILAPYKKSDRDKNNGHFVEQSTDCVFSLSLFSSFFSLPFVSGFLWIFFLPFLFLRAS